MLLPQRKSPRLLGYDYAQEGAYFVTICTEGRASRFGNIENQEMMLNRVGEMIYHWWHQLPNKYADVQLDHCVIMPNHFHGIICLNRYEVAIYLTSLSDIMRWFKAMTANAYLRGIKTNEWQAENGKLWQRSYHDHIIRNEADLNRIREYVIYNPAHWHEDTFYSEA